MCTWENAQTNWKRGSQKPPETPETSVLCRCLDRKTPSRFGNCYALVLKDLFTRELFVYPVPSKKSSDSVAAIRKFRAEVFGTLSCEDVVLQIDCDPSFLSSDFLQQLSEYNWIANLRAPQAGDHSTHYYVSVLLGLLLTLCLLFSRMRAL